MTTYKIVRLPKKVWIGRDGVLGAAHQNRDGRWVDFRPAARVDCYRPFHEEGTWTVDFAPPKSSGLRVFTVRYRTVKNVQYTMTPDARIKAQVTLTEPHCVKPLEEGEPPAEITFEHPCEIPGWPLPEEIAAVIKAQVAERAAADAERWAAYEQRMAAAVPAIENWLESQPPQSQVRRWAQRWLTTGGAHHQLMAAAKTFHPSLPAVAIESALNTWREKVRSA